MKLVTIITITIFIMSFIMLYFAFVGIVRQKATSRKIEALPEKIRPKAARVYGIGSLVCGIGGILIGLSFIKDYVGFEIPYQMGMIILIAGLIVQIFAQKMR